MTETEPTQRDTIENNQRWKRFLWSLTRISLVTYLAVVLIMMFLENRVIFPAPKYPSGFWQPEDLPYEDIYFASADGTRLHGWHVDHPSPRAYVLFCHGNGEHVAGLASLIRSYHNDLQLSVFAFDYRGYGRSEGSPHEAGVLADGHAARHWLAERARIDPDQIVLIGRSLGGAVAVDLAASGGARGLVLERTFTKLPDVASRVYPFLPVRLLMRSKFDSLTKIQQYQGPLLQSHGTEDNIVPIDLGRQLFDAAPSADKRFLTEHNVGHNDPYSRNYFTTLSDFIGRLPDGNDRQVAK